MTCYPGRAAACATYSAVDRHLIGVSILARFLKLPLRKYETMIEKVEASLVFTRLSPGIISTNLFPRAQVIESPRDLTPNAIGQLRNDKWGFYVSYRYAGLACDYAIDEGKMKRLRRSQALSPGDETEIQALRRRLRLINTRNRLTYMTLMGIAEHQEDYLVSGDPLYLKPLSQISLAEWIGSKAENAGRFLPPGSELEFVDHSMISRLTRTMSVLSLQDQEVPLRSFFPSTRDVHKRLIKAILDEEKEQIRQGDIEGAYTDEEIKEGLKERFGVLVSRRTVSVCRQSMRIPSSYTRGRNLLYPPREARFSFHHLFDTTSVRAEAPEVPAVYEISLAKMEVDYRLCSSGVVYIGSANNLRKRLRDHLRPGSKNGDLRELLGSHRCTFRYMLLNGNLREMEKELCRSFGADYGSLPRCNRISP